MSDNNQQIIEVLEILQTKFKDHGRYVSADLIQEEIDNLKPKPQCSVGKAYIIKDSRYGLEIHAIYRGDDEWVALHPSSGDMMERSTLEEGDEVFEVTKAIPLQTVTTIEELENLPTNAVIRSHTVNMVKDVAIKGAIGRWWRDGCGGSATPEDILSFRDTWDVISLG